MPDLSSEANSRQDRSPGGRQDRLPTSRSVPAAGSKPPGSETSTPSRQGPGRLLIAVYTIFAVAATARASWQIVTDFDTAPLAYSLSAVAGLIYLVAAIGIARSDRLSHTVAAVSCAVELVGVLVVGFFSLIRPDLFPEATVWSHFGSGYGFVPLVLPLMGLAWLRRVRRTPVAR